MQKKTKAASKSKAPAKAKAAAKPKITAKTKAGTSKVTAKTSATAKSQPAAKAPAKAKGAASSARNVKKFNAPQSQDFTISDNSGVIGQVRVKPNAVAWKPKRGKAYHQISLEQLAAFAAEHGREVKS